MTSTARTLDLDTDSTDGFSSDEVATDVWTVVAAAQAGDSAAFGELYRRYSAEVLRFVTNRVHSRELAEDLTSETFIRALRRIGDVRFTGRDFAAWLMTIARNLTIDHVRSAHARLVSTTDPLERPEYSVESSERVALQRMDDRLVADAVESLSERQRQCIELRFYRGASVREAAAVLGAPESAVKALQHRAVRRLGTALDGEGLRGWADAA